jgi:hypothetical protein
MTKDKGGIKVKPEQLNKLALNNAKWLVSQAPEGPFDIARVLAEARKQAMALIAAAEVSHVTL